jgi:ABC-type dipeptide/oligopeptide/nickel transport system ATPase subunit
LNFIKNNYTDSKSIISKIINITDDHIKKDTSINIIEENTEAIKILKKFIYKTECVVCDCENIDSNQLFESKKINKENVINALDKKTKAILEEIINEVKTDDPFSIKQIFIKAIEEGNKTIINELQEEIKKYFIFFDNTITNSLAKCYEENKIIKEFFDEYNEILKSKPEMTDEDIIYIETLVNENIEKEIKLDRDANNNLKLLLDGNDFIGINRNELHLSNGEQNFISLAFELLKAKNTTNKIIILDDPISSFDSIYKNKIAYLIIKVLEKKKQIILSHNVDLIRLLEHQKQKCFNLYLFNNKEGEVNGFIKVNENEQKILLYIDKLLDLFRNDISNEIEDEKTFLISIIPFMRGYAQIINSDKKNNLTKLMHGYKTDNINITEIFNVLFDQNINTDYFVSAKEISELNIDGLNILKQENYPLLNKTLKHSINYLYLRLNVEKVLSEKYNVNTSKYDMLSNIIFESFKGNDPINIRHRIFFTSRKTLLNEFNHFEGNLNIFQPAIDISDTALEKEKKSIMEYLENLQN